MTEVPEGYKRCSKCGEVKPVGEFSRNKSTKDRLRSECKECEKEYRKETKDKQQKRRIKYYRCTKKPSCPAVGGLGAEFVILTCPICGKEFRRLKSKYDWDYENNGQTHYYCSLECYRISTRKARQTEYEKNIKRIRKEQRL